jgi:alpha-L-fucosidase
MPYSTQVLADTPVGYWRLGESSGTSAADASGNGLTGTYEGSFSLGQTSLSGEANTAASLTGGSGRVNCGNPSPLQIVGNVTVEVLVKLNAVPANGVRVLAGKGLQGGPAREGYVLRIYKDASNYVLTFVSYDDPNEYDISIPITWAAGETYHVVGRHLAGQRSIWVNGVKVVEAAKAQGAIATSAPFLIGAESQFGSIVNHLDATYDEVAVYNYGLSDARIAAHYAEIGGPPPAAATLDSASVSANGVDVVANFSTAVSGVAANQFNIVSAGKSVPILSVSGSGTATLTFRLAKSWIAAGDTVRLSYFGSGLTSVGGAPLKAKVTATNGSTVSRKKTRYVNREFGMFIHCSSASYNMPYNPSPAQMNLFNPVNLNVGQWLDAAVGAGMKYAVLTTKHDGGFCIWPSATTPRGIISTSWYAATQIDIVREFVNGCRSRGLGVGLYINFYDPYYKDERPGATGDYTGFTSYISAQITELLTNYGQIDLLWLDSWHYRPEVSYGVVPYATIQTLVNTLQPNCALANNARGSEAVSEVAITEGSGAPDVPPVFGNLKPVEFVDTSNSNNIWEWNAANDANLRPALDLVKQLEEIKQARGCYMVNFSPDRDGVFSAPQLAVLSQIGEAIGQQGGTKLPPRPVVQLGVDRGDGEMGLLISSNGGGNIIAGLI